MTTTQTRPAARSIATAHKLGDAAIYARQSRTDDSKKDKQKKDQNVETTLDTQAAACKRAAQSLGYTVSPNAVFTERYTGAEMWDRPVLSDLRRRIKSREYNALFVYSTDRLARDPIHLALILEECQRAGCDLRFVTEPLEDSPEGELILYIKGYAAKIERLRIKDRMARGRNAILAAGKLTCQSLPTYGYKYDTEKRVHLIDDAAAPMVRNIFRWCVEGMSVRRIADRLNSMKVPSPAAYQGKTFKRGRPVWNSSTVHALLNDEAYTGVAYVNKTKVTDERVKATGRHRAQNVDKKNWKKLPEGTTPAIIERETFDAVQRALSNKRRRASYSRNSLRPVLLRGIVFCANCGCPLYPMSESTHKQDEPVRAVYRCAASRLKRTSLAVPSAIRPYSDATPSLCRAKRLIADSLEGMVWSKLVTFFMAPELVEAEVKRLLSDLPDDGLHSDLVSAEKELIKARRLRDNALDKYEDAIAEGDDEMAARWDRKSKEANSDVRALSAVVKDLTARLAAFSNSGKTARAFAKQCKQVMTSMTGTFTFEEKRAALEALDAKVYAAAGQPIRIIITTGVLQPEEQSVGIEVTV